MDQEKIGKFIFKLRKEKGLTQQEFAEKLKVTDRAISNWENGKNMPDLALFKPICDVFEISINELLSGERLQDSDYQKRFEENVINTVIHEKKKSSIKKKLLIVVLLIGLIFSGLFLLDKKRMNEVQEVVFSTWGNNDYNSNLYWQNKYLETAIKRYLLKNKKELYTDTTGHTYNVLNFVNLHTFLVEKIDNNTFNVYLWAIMGSHYEDEQNNEIALVEKISQPYKFRVKKTNDFDYEVLNVWLPSNKRGIGYLDEYDFLKTYFPKSIFKEANNFYGSKEYTKLEYDYWENVENAYYKFIFD